MALWFDTKHFSISSRGRVGARLGPLAAYAGGRRRTNSSSGLLGGVIILAIIAGLCLLALECIAAVPGHLLGWTPSIGEIFKSNPRPGYIHSLYRNVVLGFVLAGLLLLIALVWMIRVANRQQALRTSLIAAVLAVAVVVLIAVTDTGLRSHQLSPAQAVGISMPKAQGVLQAAANKGVRGYSGTGDSFVDDVAYAPGWVTIPQRCRFSSYSDGFLGKSWNFTCTVDAENHRAHRSTIFRAAVTCYDDQPTLHNCLSDSDYDVKDTRDAVAGFH